MLNPRFRCQVGTVPAEKVQYFVNAADALVISRLQVLNSANVKVGSSFGKVVVGPDSGVVGEILHQTGSLYPWRFSISRQGAVASLSALQQWSW